MRKTSNPSAGDPTAHFIRAVPVDDLMRHVACISAHDRFQASRGLEDAASIVADAASDAGLSDVRVERYPADGVTRWWTFQAPLSWTPLTAQLEVRVNDEVSLEIDHARQPFSIATYSAATLPGGIEAPMVRVPGTIQGLNLLGAIAVVSGVDFTRSDLLSDLADAGAVGFVTDAATCSGPGDLVHPGRIELDPLTRLFGFSVTPNEMTIIERCVEAGAKAHAVVEIDHIAKMPVVTGVLPGIRGGEEIWLTAHLCHPRPSANDNASGVAALLGVAAAHSCLRRAHARWGAERTIRFVWGPEFVGTAAMLHASVTRRTEATPPSAVINLDMVGEDQALCGGPFLVERNPDSQPSMIGPIAEHVVGRVFANTRPHPGDWRPVPFTGLSDHALFAGPHLGCPAVQFCHAPDRFNHSAGDSWDKVSAVEMRRATAAGAALAWILASDNGLPRPVLEQVVHKWSRTELAGAQEIAREYDGSNPEWAQRLLRYARHRTDAMHSLLPQAAEGRISTNSGPPAGPAPTLSSCWSGPINLRAMLADLPAAQRSVIADLLRTDRRHHALLLNFAIRVDGRRTRQQIVDETSFALRRPISDATAEALLGALIDSGWVTTASSGSREQRVLE
jgi:hypothetical protein